MPIIQRYEYLKEAKMQQAESLMGAPKSSSTANVITGRDLKYVATDTSAVRAIAQAAVNVELFTIPLYMTTMYSIYGMHQINAKEQTYYKGREWPGLATRAVPANDNEKAFNIIFSVFIQEMLHLQMASNIATALDVQPSFTSTALQTKNHGWHCYGPQKTVIPQIVDLKHTKEYSHVRVNLEELNQNQTSLFLAIEQPADKANSQFDHLPTDEVLKLGYFPTVPFKDWKVGYTDVDLPLFGTIGHMYECYAQYLSITYTDGQNLWQKMFKPGSVQQDLFNANKDDPSNPNSNGHPRKEFPLFETWLNAEDQKDPMLAYDKVIDMMSAITDQGEGNSTGIQRFRRKHMLTAVQEKYQEDRAALDVDYPSYDQSGSSAPSRDAAARADSKKLDHYERFQEVQGILARVITWDKWHATGGKEGRQWTGKDLSNAAYDPNTAPKNIPTPDQVAAALNQLHAEGESTRKIMSEVAVGAIAGITTVLDTFWKVQDTLFPYPSMAGSGDRVSINWAIFGKAPDLSLGLKAPDPTVLYHACQGLSLANHDTKASCAAVEIYHTCKGSNGCHAQGGCGFAHPDTGGGNCSQSAVSNSASAVKGTCGAPIPYSAPSDNKCKTFGGCAVPISASQLYPVTAPPPVMKLYDFVGPEHTSTPLDKTMAFTVRDSVYEKAWEAYCTVMDSRGTPVKDKMPAPTALRVALPPST
jgi:hypothetical protein